MSVGMGKTTITGLIFTLITAISINAADRLSPGLDEAVSAISEANDSLVSVVVFLDDQDDTDRPAFFAPGARMSRADRIRRVSEQLKAYRAPARDNVLSYLENHSTTPVVEHWIVPAFTATIKLSEIEALSQWFGIRLLVENATLVYDPPVEGSKAPPSLAASVSSQLAQLNIPYLWQRGLTGKGRLVCSFDTGVEQSHPALSDRWRGNHATLQSSWFSMVAPDTLPYDNAGHGTHTMGIMVGATPADTFGVAPEAEWITAGIIDQGRSLSVTISDIIEAFQWAFNPDGDDSTTDDVPDVILNSWGIPGGLFEPCDETFWGVIDNVEAAGIVTIFAAGNEGPDPMSLRNPADRASTPLNSFSVGAVDNQLVIGSFSSRGPSSCDTTQVKPEIVAPGVSIRSSYRGGGYFYMTGTSMAAPYVAGMVALVRQYNPDATVDEIKSAFIQAATDLGDPGEDNAYGHGFIDASRLLEFVQIPVDAEFEIVGYQVSDDGIAFPGESFGLQLMINNAAGNVDSAYGVISQIDKGMIDIAQDEAGFYFGDGGTTALNYEPFLISFADDLYNGEEIAFRLCLTAANGTTCDTLSFALTVGVSPKGDIAAHSNGTIEVAVSDFGQFGFAPGSIYNVAGEGFRFAGGANLLYEAGLVIGRNSLQLSRAIRGEYGDFRVSDFSPVEDLSDPWMDTEGAMHRTAVFDDSYSAIPIPISVRQETICAHDVTDNGFLLVRYELVNGTIEPITNLHFGFLSDFDLSAEDRVWFDAETQMIYQLGEDGQYAGLVALENITGFKAFENDGGKTGFSGSALFDLLADEQNDVDGTLEGDLMFLVSSGSFTVGARDSMTVAFALVAAADIEELYRNVDQAKASFNSYALAVEDNNGLLPDAFELFQNYPNPFNPTTNISFALAEAGTVTLDIYNVLGRKVKNLHSGPLEAGEHRFEWDAMTDSGTEVASGIYFYRLSTESFAQSKKMLLLR